MVVGVQNGVVVRVCLLWVSHLTVRGGDRDGEVGKVGVALSIGEAIAAISRAKNSAGVEVGGNSVTRMLHREGINGGAYDAVRVAQYGGETVMEVEVVGRVTLDTVSYTHLTLPTIYSV